MEQLRIARGAAPGVALVQADMTRLEIRERSLAAVAGKQKSLRTWTSATCG